MTLVVGQQFGDRIVLFADTMVSDPSQTRPDTIPGQLKLIVLNTLLSVAYAGHLHRARTAIRACKELVDAGSGLAAVINHLQKESAGDECEFLVASHEQGAALVKIRRGQVSDPQLQHWLGDREALRLFQETAEENAATYRANQIAHRISDESAFTQAFGGLLISTSRVTDVVGGFATQLLASPYGHTYPLRAGAYRAGPVYGGSQLSPDAIAGCPQFAYQQCDCGYRGVALTAFHVQETQTAYFYNPLLDDAPRTVRNMRGSEVSPVLHAMASGRGGVSEDYIRSLP